MDTDFCGNWFSKGESIDNRGSQRLQGNSLVSASCDRSTVNSETWRTTEASLRIPPPHLVLVRSSTIADPYTIVQDGLVCQGTASCRERRKQADPTRISLVAPAKKFVASLSQIPPIVPVLPTHPTHKCCAVYNLRFDSFHGTEEVIGSIPIRSTSYFNNL
jgi:hypothetical protein